MASRLDDLLDPEFRFKTRIAGRRGRGDAHRVTSLRAALSGLGQSKPYDVGRARENSRRCIVKCHYVSMHGGGRDAARLHLAYLERDGVERDGSPGHVYGADASFDKAGFAEPLKGEKNQFRFIVWPEDGRDVYLQAFTCELWRRWQWTWAACSSGRRSRWPPPVSKGGLSRPTKTNRYPRAPHYGSPGGKNDHDPQALPTRSLRVGRRAPPGGFYHRDPIRGGGSRLEIPQT